MALLQFNHLIHPAGMDAPGELHMANTDRLKAGEPFAKLQRLFSTKHHQQGLVVQRINQT